MRPTDTRDRLLFSIAFALALAQEPLYFANQNTKYLHGAGAAGYGWLSSDWMAQTIDPLPVFSMIVRLMFELGLPELSYVIFALLAIVWAWTLTAIVRSAGMLSDRRAHVAMFMTALIVTQAVFAKWPRGLADQNLHDHYLQPGVFGVLVFAGIAQFLERRTAAAIVLTVAASIVHPDYLPTTGVCVLVFIATSTARSSRALRWASYHLLLALVLIAPIAIQLRTIAARTSPETWQRALDVLVRHIPEHTDITYWFDWGSLARLVVMAVGAGLARDRRLALVMWALFALIVISMAVVIAFGWEVVAAITPWRASALLMPLALAVITARGVTWVASDRPWRERQVMITCTLLAVSAIAYGFWRQTERWSRYAGAESMPPIRWIQAHHERLELFLIPPQDSDFDRFRLETGQPIFINWKTHPYKDVELLEWGHRLQQAERFYSARSPGEACRQLSWLSRHYAVSAVVYAISHPIESGGCPLIEEIGHAGEYAIARVRAGP